MDDKVLTIPARRGRAVRVRRREAIKIINTHGSQVVDTWAFVEGAAVEGVLTEFLSMEHTRASLLKLRPAAGDTLVTNRRRPVFVLVEDTSPGIHDTLIAACDNERYELLGCTEYHDNCTDNLHAALAELGLRAQQTPSPLNLFMNIPWTAQGDLAFEAPCNRPGDYVVLRAEVDCIVAMSACPQDILPINGLARRPTEVHIEILA
jgi:uncharacterized protein YcgI (DUF1989 family)